jgi:hypothetical protein
VRGFSGHDNEPTDSTYQVAWFFWMGREWVRLVRRPLPGLLYPPRMMDVEELADDWQGKPATVSLYPPQIPHDLNRVRTGMPR